MVVGVMTRTPYFIHRMPRQLLAGLFAELTLFVWGADVMNRRDADDGLGFL